MLQKKMTKNTLETHHFREESLERIHITRMTNNVDTMHSNVRTLHVPLIGDGALHGFVRSRGKYFDKHDKGGEKLQKC